MTGRVFWEWLCSLYSSSSKEVIDPYLWKCPCGYSWKFNKLQLIRMLLFEDYVHTCPRCFHKSRYRLISHVVRDTDTEEIKENNRRLME